MQKYKSLYDSLIDNNELLDLFPELINKNSENCWELDEEEFSKLIYNQEKSLDGLNSNEDDEYIVCQ